MGLLLGNAVRFGARGSTSSIAGEGLETILSLRQIMPSMPMAAALSANHLAALRSACRLAIGSTSRGTTIQQDIVRWKSWPSARESTGIEALTLASALGDFNEDLRRLGPEALRDGLRAQLAPQDGCSLADY